MIKANELRLGNYFHPNSISNGIRIPSTAIWYKVGAINNFGEIEVNDPHRKETLVFSTKEIDPIPLTPEILEACGFIEDNEYDLKEVSKRYSLQLAVNGENKNELIFHLGLMGNLESWGCYTVNNHWASNHFKYLHELQNLIYALTGQELSIKEPSKTIPA